MQHADDLEGYDEMLKKLLDSLTLEERVAGLSAEQRLLLAPDEALRSLAPEYVRSLPADVQEEIRGRVARACRDA